MFLLEARRILRLAESAALATRRIASGEAGTITLGFTAASGYSFLPRLLLQRASHAPNIDVALKEMVSTEQVESLLTGRIDIGLLRPPIGRSEFTTLKVAEERLVAALPVGDPRLAEATLNLTHFDRQPLIMYAAEGARYFHDMLAELFEAEGIVAHRHPVAEPDPFHAGAGARRHRRRPGAGSGPIAAFRRCAVPPGGDRSAPAGGTVCRLAQRQ